MPPKPPQDVNSLHFHESCGTLARRGHIESANCLSKTRHYNMSSLVRKAKSSEFILSKAMRTPFAGRSCGKDWGFGGLQLPARKTANSGKKDGQLDERCWPSSFASAFGQILGRKRGSADVASLWGDTTSALKSVSRGGYSGGRLLARKDRVLHGLPDAELKCGFRGNLNGR